MSSINRRDLLSLAALTAAGLALGPVARSFGADDTKKKILFFTRSAGFPHPVVTRKNGEEFAFAERTFRDFAGKEYEVTISKDGTLFTPEKLAAFDAVIFYTTGDETQTGPDKTPPMPAGGKESLLKFIEDGKGFMGFHCASDTFHSSNYGGKKEIARQMVMRRNECARTPARKRSVATGGVATLRD